MEAMFVREEDQLKTQGLITAIQLSAILELLVEKGIFTKKEFEESARKKTIERNMLEILMRSKPGISVTKAIEDVIKIGLSG